MVPKAQIERSSFDRSHSVKSTFDEGVLVPILVDEVLPGDTHSCSATAFVRLNTLIKPLLDNLWLDFFFFFVPNRLVWANWQKFCGEQTNPGDSISYQVPYLSTPFTVTQDTLGDYMGLPLMTNNSDYVSALPFRAYNLIYNQWFRDQNLVNSLTVATTDGPDSYGTYTLQRRAKKHDYFTSCLPSPQRGSTAVAIPLGTTAPVKGIAVPEVANLQFGTASRDATGTQIASGTWGWDTSTQAFRLVDKVNSTGTAGATHYPNVYTDLSAATAATINSLRLAFQTQRLLERDARSGTRYTEILRAHFGVVSPDARLQRPEFLGGGSLPIGVQAVPQTAPKPASGTTTDQGNLAAFGHAAGGGIGFSKSFVEHGYIIGLVSARLDITYQQGLHRHWSRQTRYDFYWPAFAHLGEQAVLNKEIYCQGDGSTNDNNAFGYQERWAEYRYKPSEIHGNFRSTSTTPIDVWHLSQKFAALPALNQTFIEEPGGATAPLYRALAVPTEKHLLGDFHFRYRSTRPMPVYSVPGMIDHF